MEQHFDWKDPSHSGYALTASLNDNGVLSFSIRMKKELSDERSRYRGEEIFDLMINHFGLENIWAIRGAWYAGDNIAEYNQNRLRMNPKNSALETWTGRMASKYGFKRVSVLNESLLLEAGESRGYSVRVLFTRRLIDLKRYKYFWDNPFS